MAISRKFNFLEPNAITESETAYPSTADLIALLKKCFVVKSLAAVSFITIDCISRSVWKDKRHLSKGYQNHAWIWHTFSQTNQGATQYMPTAKPTDYLSYWIELINKRGHSSVFATTNKTKKIVELSIACEFSKSLQYEFSILLENITNCEADPPDCLAEFNGRKMQIELVELIDQSAIKIAKKTGRTAQNDVTQFSAIQWNSDRFIEEVNKVIDSKDKKYKAADKKFEILLIYTAEPWLSPHDVKRWTYQQAFEVRDSFESVFLLMEYDPTYCQTHWPLFQLYGKNL